MSDSSTKSIFCLLVEDDEDDFLLTEDCLRDIRSSKVTVEWASDYETAAEHLLGPNVCQVCLVDYRIGARTGVDFIREMTSKGVKTPMILLTGLASEEVDREAMEAGAYDFLEKGEINTRILERSIRYAMAQAEQFRALEARTTLLKATLEHTGAGIAAFNGDMQLETFNQKVLEYLDIDFSSDDEGYSETDPGENVSAHLAGLILDKLDTAFDQEMVPLEITTPDGRFIEVRHNIAPESDRHVVVCFDITNRKLNEDELVRSREMALDASRAKSEFIANMSHELRTPLHAVIGFSDLMIGEAFGPIEVPEYKEYVQDIRNSGSHLLSLINDILDLSKIEASRYEMMDVLIDLGQVLGESLSQVQVMAEKKDIRFETSHLPDLPPVTADARAMRQILINLLSNAVKFTEAGGHVSITIEQSKEIGARIAVRDTGIGMSAEYLNRCFEPFSQEDGQLARSQEGTGLGLSLVRKLIEMHEGTVEVESELGVGTCVTVCLPPDRVAWDEGSIPSAA